MKIKYVTITGIDERTDLKRLQELQNRFPFAEFGVLMSEDWQFNGNRFPNPKPLFAQLADMNLNLSLHLCGQLAIKAVKGYFYDAERIADGNLGIFRRCQLNLKAGGLFDEIRQLQPKDSIQEIIVQMHSPELFVEFLKGHHPQGVSYLLDASGGTGTDTPIDIVTSPDIHVGYAGGISPENVAAKLRILLEHPTDDVCWIDMETRVRTEDEWLDLDKVEQVLQICDKMIDYKHRA